MQDERLANLREWVATTLNVFVAPDGLEATEEFIDTVTQVLECRAKELATALASGDPGSGWRTMDQAPKDGTAIIVTMYDESPHRAWQYGKQPVSCGVAHWTTHNGGGWVSYWPGLPIAWQPLPEPLHPPVDRRTEP